METNIIADILLNMSLDMSYWHTLENYDKTVECLKGELDELKAKGSVLFCAIENIAERNVNVFQWALRKENNYSVTVIATKNYKVKAETPELAEIEVRNLFNKDMLIDSVIVKENED